MAATCSLRPTSSASSSMHSWSIMVESMSAMQDFLAPRPAVAGRRRRSVRPQARRAGIAVASRFADAVGQGEVAGDAFGQPGDGACADRRGRHIRQRPRQTARGGMGNQRGDERHRKNPAGRGRIRNAILIAGPTASGKSRAGAGTRRAPRRRHRQRRFHAGLFGARRADRAADRRRTRARAASPLRPCPSRHRLFDRRLAARRARACRQRRACRTRAPIFVGGTGLYFRALAEGISEMPDIPHRSASAGATNWPTRAPTSCTAS